MVHETKLLQRVMLLLYQLKAVIRGRGLAYKTFNILNPFV
jgi:hypothetical protein